MTTGPGCIFLFCPIALFFNSNSSVTYLVAWVICHAYQIRQAKVNKQGEYAIPQLAEAQRLTRIQFPLIIIQGRLFQERNSNTKVQIFIYYFVLVQSLYMSCGYMHRLISRHTWKKSTRKDHQEHKLCIRYRTKRYQVE